MEALHLIANKALGGMITRRVNGAEKERQIYWDILFSCGVNCYEHDDVSWINKGLEMAKAVGRYRATVSILKTCIPFNHKDGVFGGKRKVAMYDKMKDKFEAVLLAEINKQVAEDSKPKTVAAYEFEKAKENFEKKALANGITVEVRVVETIAVAA